jgi:hypothetical protein
VVVAPIDQRDADRRVREGARRGQSAEPTPDDDHMRATLHGSLDVAIYRVDASRAEAILGVDPAPARHAAPPRRGTG